MNKTKNVNLLALLRDMAEVGVPVDLSVAELGIEIEQVGGAYESEVFDLSDGRTGWIISVMMTNRTPRPIQVRDIEPRPFWDNSEFGWLPDPKGDGTDPFGKGAPEFPRGQVINHIPLDHGILKPRCPVRGLLLGIGNPKPDLLSGAFIDAKLAIIGEDHIEYEEKIKLWVDPVMKRQHNSPRRRSFGSLYADDQPQNPRSPDFDKAGKVPGSESAPVKKNQPRLVKSAKVVRRN
jgi:hypothetical protein